MPRDEIKALYLPKLISGEWTGTMNLTEPQAGSDVGALTTKAVPNGDGTYAITGQKIYISWGDHDFGGNVCHLVLARLPDAPAGHQGDQPVHGAEVPPRRRRQPRARATACGWSASSTSWACTARPPA